MYYQPHNPKHNILVVTGSHEYDGTGFHRLLDEVLVRDKGIGWTNVEYPAAQEFLRPDLAKPYQAILFYDMAGVEFLPNMGGTVLHDPSAALMKNMEALLDEGKPMLFLHHASGSWQSNERYSKIVGGSYLVTPLERDGKLVPESGVQQGAFHRINPVLDHPITEGLEEGFDIDDEIFLQHVYEDSIIPLMRSSIPATRDNFYSPVNIFAGKGWTNEGWYPPKGSNVVVWMRKEKNSPIVYIQPGHAPPAYDNSGFRRLFGNTVSWLISEDAARFGRGG